MKSEKLETKSEELETKKSKKAESTIIGQTSTVIPNAFYFFTLLPLTGFLPFYSFTFLPLTGFFTFLLLKAITP